MYIWVYVFVYNFSLYIEARRWDFELTHWTGTSWHIFPASIRSYCLFLLMSCTLTINQKSRYFII